MDLSSVVKAASWNIVIQQGSTFARTLTFDLSMDGFDFRGQIRRNHADTAVLGEFTFLLADAFTLVVSLTPTQTAALPAEKLVYDVEAFLPGEAEVARILEGRIVVTPEVTR